MADKRIDKLFVESMPNGVPPQCASQTVVSKKSVVQQEDDGEGMLLCGYVPFFSLTQAAFRYMQVLRAKLSSQLQMQRLSSGEFIDSTSMSPELATIK